MGRAKVRVVVLSILLGTSCQDRKPQEVTPAPSQGAASGALAELTRQYRTASLAGRMQAAADATYVGKNSDPIRCEALLAAADDESERAALAATGRPVFARQYQQALIADRQQVDGVSAVGKQGATLGIKGAVCSRFFLENLAGRPEGRMARLLGFERLECSSQAVQVSLTLGRER
jgi:hypothetical protein